MPQTRSYGWQLQPKDYRDFHFHPPLRLMRGVPPTVDLSGKMGQQLDQSTEGSCGPNSAVECLMFDQVLQRLTSTVLSRQFIYYFTRLLMGTTGQDSGVDNRSMGKALATYGAPPETLWPYLPGPAGNMTQRPSDAAVVAGAKSRITSYSFIGTNRAEMQGTLNSGFTFIMGGEVFKGIESDQAAETGIVPAPSTLDNPIGGHDVTVCGFNFTGADLPGVTAGKKWPDGTYRFRNHWMNGPGIPWGDGGYGYWPAAYAEDAQLMSDFMVINAVPGNTPPTPTPTPPVPTPVPVPPTPPGPGPGPVDPSAITKMVDAAFAQLEAKYPQYRAFLQSVNVLVDRYLQGHLPQTVFVQELGRTMTVHAPARNLPTFSVDWSKVIQDVQLLLPVLEQLAKVLSSL